MGVAIIGSVFASVYRDRLTACTLDATFPAEVLAPARDSIGAALVVAGRLTEAGQPAIAAQLAALARTGVLDGWAVGCLVAAGVAFVGAAITALVLPAQPTAAPTSARPALRAAATVARFDRGAPV